jgi:ketosteroid isomerase-like protein
MRLTALLLATLTLSGCAAAGRSTTDDARLEATIRALEQAEVDALLRDDLAVVRANWADDLVVNNPFNVVVDASQGPIQAGTLTYSAFDREIERVLVRGNTVVVMGREIVVPSGSSPDAGQTIHRRFTNVWMNRDGRWLLSARHASVVRREGEHADILEEARAFMDDYARDLRAGDRAAIAARYDRDGAYVLGHGRKELMPHEAIVAMYQGPDWSPPASFEWQDLSFEAAGSDAIAVAGRFQWAMPAAPAPMVFSYAALLRRRDGVLRIRLEDESFDPRTLPAEPAPGGSDR